MELKKPKKLYRAAALVLISLVFCLLLAFFFAGKGAYGGAFLRKDVSFTVRDDKTGEIFLSSDKTKAFPEKNADLKIENGENKSLDLTLYQWGKEIGKVSLLPKEEKKILLSSSGAPISALIQREEGDVAYISQKEDLSGILKEMENGGDLVFLSLINLENFSLNAPFRLFGNFSFDELSFETAKKGKIVLSPEKKFTGTVFASAPDCTFVYKNLTFDFSKEETDFYLKTQSVNGKSLSPKAFPVSSFENLKRLAERSLLPKLNPDSEIIFTSSFAIKESLSFEGTYFLHFKKSVDFGENTLSFSSNKKGRYEVKTALGVQVSGASLVFCAPRATLLWEGEGAIPALSTVEKFSNLKEYNGSPTRLGGEGEAIPSLSLSAKDNPVLEEDISFRIKGNLLVAEFPYLLDQEDLKKMQFSLTAKKGSVMLEGDLSSGVIVAKDLSGKERRFRVEILRETLNIPVVHIETENKAEITSKSQYVSATFSMTGGEYPSLAETHIRIRGRGNSSWKWDKKPYKIHFDQPTSLLGLPEGEEWALVSNYADKSLMRNHLAQVMASTLSFDYSPTQAFVDVFLNGEYLGVYTLGEHLEAGAGRVEVEYDPGAVDCGYFLEAGGVVSGVDVKGMNYFHADLLKFVLIKSPEYTTLTSEQFQFIKDYFQKTNAAIKKGEGYEKYLDMESVIDWLIMTELTCNTDCSWRRSTYFKKNPGEKLVMGPVWDFDLAFGNFSKDNPDYDAWVSTEPDDDYIGETWSTHLLKDPEFQKAFRKRWQAVSKNLLQTAFSEIERSYELLSPSANLNFKRWDILGRKVAFERYDTTEYKTYSSQIYYLQNFLTQRAAWIDAQVENW